MSHLCILSTLQNITDNISEEEALIFSSGLISPVPISSTLHSFLTWGTVSFHTVLNFKNLGVTVHFVLSFLVQVNHEILSHFPCEYF